MTHTGSVEQPRRHPTSDVVNAALDAGHDPQVAHEGRRFRLVCSCGFRTPLQMSRKVAFAAISDHVYEVGRAVLEASDTPPVVDLPQTVRATG
jgi:hypothetical protein